ncbi:hypothetical protein CRG98_031810, partial [Punica granatum]
TIHHGLGPRLPYGLLDCGRRIIGLFDWASITHDPVGPNASEMGRPSRIEPIVRNWTIRTCNCYLIHAFEKQRMRKTHAFLPVETAPTNFPSILVELLNQRSGNYEADNRWLGGGHFVHKNHRKVDPEA